MCPKVMDWELLRPTDTELELALVHDAEPLRAFLKRLVKVVLMDAPWEDHNETVAVFDPSCPYAKGDRVAISGNELEKQDYYEPNRH